MSSTGGLERAESGLCRSADEALSGQALDGLLEEFATRDGTDYGAEERTSG